MASIEMFSANDSNGELPTVDFKAGIADQLLAENASKTHTPASDQAESCLIVFSGFNGRVFIDGVKAEDILWDEVSHIVAWNAQACKFPQGRRIAFGANYQEVVGTVYIDEDDVHAPAEQGIFHLFNIIQIYVGLDDVSLSRLLSAAPSAAYSASFKRLGWLGFVVCVAGLVSSSALDSNKTPAEGRLVNINKIFIGIELVLASLEVICLVIHCFGWLFGSTAVISACAFFGPGERCFLLLVDEANVHVTAIAVFVNAGVIVALIMIAVNWIVQAPDPIEQFIDKYGKEYKLLMGIRTKPQTS
ncbi:hypothetical protein DFH09DRAFT_1322795 [Mycena vulgaris]|nr:hypothetical protein DFH09DRAFT_1322795 [Mycena vulgaris]